jgi:Na+/H+ antiporter NhaA
MELVWLIMKMAVYGLIVGLVIGAGAFCYAFISIHFAERPKEIWGKRKGGLTGLPNGHAKSRP